ncbi:MlaA family lipoprotein [Zavarzinia sp. CC-PAN008]|uniref:MlaA family lipoprotein n=1 Tax=Zavarzinia sp. CC-PAN008 TaxID=3243332 RepID=UPI003F746D48
MRHALILILAALSVAGCAAVPEDPIEREEYELANDPLEPTNRAIFDANQFLDRNVLKPVATAYDEHVPEEGRDGVRNFVNNLAEPTVLVNDVLQGNFERAWNTTQRFVVNSTAGVGGLFDVAGDHLDLPHHQADFGQTFGVWGIEQGPAVQLPLLGPSNARDAVGTVMGFVANPLGFIDSGTMSSITYAGLGSGTIDGRARALPVTNDLEANSLDYYSASRSLASQYRDRMVQEGKDGLVGNEPQGEVTIDPDSVVIE